MSTALRIAFALLVGIAFSQEAAAAKRGANSGNSVTIITTGGEQGSMPAAADLADILDEGEELRVLPMVGRGPVQSLTDLLRIKGIDAAIVPADALAYAERHKLLKGAAKKVRYAAKLGLRDIHVIARSGVRSLADLKGKKVDLGLTDEERFCGASLLFEMLAIEVEAASGPASIAVERLKKGEIDAAVLYGGKPLAALAGIATKDGLTILPIPSHAELARIYAPQIFDGKDYPGLIGGKDMVESLSVGMVLAVYDWPAGSAGAKKLEALTTTLFASGDLLHEGKRRAEWRDVNLTASVQGWTRYGQAEAWLKKSPQPAPALESEFTSYVARAEPSGSGGEEALFARFLAWQKKAKQ
jgi:TRAP-type uncharacterized transport system substrate-binding protein